MRHWTISSRQQFEGETESGARRALEGNLSPDRESLPIRKTLHFVAEGDLGILLLGLEFKNGKKV